ncbi:MAG: hypothetical protein AB7O97_04600 [Planctomycetota bacterium]
MTAPNDSPNGSPDGRAALQRRHLRLGWGALLLFVLLGTALEVLHGLKADFYLDPEFETRRLLWRLAHAHGTFLALVHLAFAFTLDKVQTPPRLASPCFTGALIAVPLGFFLGGVTVHGGDPGAGIALLPLGVLLLLIAIAQTARTALR